LIDNHRENEDFVIAAEYQVLKLYLSNPTIDWKELSSSSFPHKKAKVLYKAISILQDSKESVTEGSLFREANQIDDSIDLPIITSVLDYDADLSNLDKALKTLKKASIKSRLNFYVDRLSEVVKNKDELDYTLVASFLYEAQELLSEDKDTSLSKNLIECLTEYEEELRLRQAGKYYPFHDTYLDRVLTKKAAPGQIILIAGATGTGKSIYALSLINGFINTNIPCMYFSPEMDTISTMDRLMSMRSGIPIEEWYKTGIAIDPLLRIVDEEKTKLAGKTFRFIDDPAIDLNTIRELIKEFKITYKTNYLIVIVDLVTQVRDFIDSKSKFTLANIIEISVNELNAIAKKENVCIIAVAQMNRDADNMKVQTMEDLERLRPTLNNIKNSNALAERARTVLSVFRRKYYAQRYLPEDPETEFMLNDLEIQVLKQSMGDVGQFGHYLFDGPTFTLREHIQEWEEKKDES